MKIFRFLAVAIVAMLGLVACNNDCEHEFIEVDHSADLVGTWTCLDAGYAEALIISADGSVVSTGVENGEYWENVAGSIKVVNNKMTMTFEDGDNYEGRFEMICGEAFTIIEEDGKHFTYRYCKNDLADEIVGMWVCTDSNIEAQNDMLIQTFNDNGNTIMTGYLPTGMDAEYILGEEGGYKVFGDLVFIEISTNNDSDNNPFYVAKKLIYTPKATSLGDVMTFRCYISIDNNFVEMSESWLRIKQTLDLAEKKYDYIKTFVSNVKGEDKDIEFFNTTFNFAKFDNSMLDKFLKSTLFSVHFPDANTIEYSFLLGEQLTSMQAPIAVDGNKMTIKMSELNAVYRDVDVYTFQDQDNTQMHIYMPTSSFENFLGNMQLNIMAANGKTDLADAAAVKAVFDTIENAIETINVSFVMTKAAR